MTGWISAKKKEEKFKYTGIGLYIIYIPSTQPHIWKDIDQRAKTRRLSMLGVRAQYNQPFVAQLQVVPFNRTHVTLTPTSPLCKQSPSPSLGRGPGFSGLRAITTSITVKWRLRARVSNTCAHTHNKDTLRKTWTTKNAQIRLPLQFWILLLMLLISISANSCVGAYSDAHRQCRPCPHGYKPLSSL